MMYKKNVCVAQQISGSAPVRALPGNHIWPR